MATTARTTTEEDKAAYQKLRVEFELASKQSQEAAQRSYALWRQLDTHPGNPNRSEGMRRQAEYDARDRAVVDRENRKAAATLEYSTKNHAEFKRLVEDKIKEFQLDPRRIVAQKSEVYRSNLHYMWVSQNVGDDDMTIKCCQLMGMMGMDTWSDTSKFVRQLTPPTSMPTPPKGVNLLDGME